MDIYVGQTAGRSNTFTTELAITVTRADGEKVPESVASCYTFSPE